MNRQSAESELEWLTARLLDTVQDARKGLPQPVFELLSRLTPLVNVDLLVKDSNGGTLLTWRGDKFYGPGWHIPGGIVRYKEHMADRIAAVAHSELGATVSFDAVPLVMREIHAPHREVRGHFISLLFACTLTAPLDTNLKFDANAPKTGQWMWHNASPENLIPAHRAYVPWIDNAAPLGFSLLSR